MIILFFNLIIEDFHIKFKKSQATNYLVNITKADPGHNLGVLITCIYSEMEYGLVNPGTLLVY